jgi:hypothetical protein
LENVWLKILHKVGTVYSKHGGKINQLHVNFSKNALHRKGHMHTFNMYP